MYHAEYIDYLASSGCMFLKPDAIERVETEHTGYVAYTRECIQHTQSLLNIGRGLSEL